MKRRAPYKLADLVRLTGLTPALLRAWERRHGLLRPRRGSGGHRLYGEDDVHVLRRVQELLGQGRSIGAIAELGRAALLAAARTDPPPVPTAVERVVDVWREDLVQAAVTLDGPRAERVLDQAFASLTPDRAIGDVVEPGMRAIGDRWGWGRCSVAGEHLVGGLVAGRLRRLFDAAASATAPGPQAVCACLPDEQHALGVLAVAYWLARHGHRVTWLGPAVPLDDLDLVCQLLAPDEVYLSVTDVALFEAAAPALIALARRRRAVRFHVGGQGAPAADHALDRAGIVLVGVTKFADLRPACFARPREAAGRSRDG